MNKILLLLLLAAPVIAQKNNDPFDRVRATIQQQMRDRRVPSVAVAVARDGKIIWEEAFGWANREQQIKATPQTMYSLASISKPFTATALMILKERGKIDLDRQINEYLGAAKINVRVGNPNDLTIRRVANHSSGLPLHFHFFYADEPFRAPTRDETILRYGNTLTAPGEKYQYSNLGYGILDHVIARVSGKDYADFMRTEVFVPLGMKHSVIALQPEIAPGIKKQHAIRYGEDGSPIPFYEFDHPGASAVYASAHDLVRFGMFHLKTHLPDQKAILSDASLDEMHRPTMKAEEAWSYGVGWRSGQHSSGHCVIFHTGGMGGVSVILCLLPDAKIAFVVLANANNDLAGQPPLPNIIRDEIIAALLPPVPRAAATPPPVSSSAKLIGEWRGYVHTYKAGLPFTLEIKADDDVHVQLGDQLKTLLNRFSVKGDYVTGVFNGDIGTEDANRTKYSLNLSLKLRGNVLNGAMTALSLPGKRVGNALTHWVELKKQ